MQRSLTIYCDESTSKGRYFSNFYGGLIIDEATRQSVEARLNSIKEKNNLFGEIKWTKITENYAEKYINVIDAVFEEFNRGTIKIRVMFTKNSLVPTGLTENHRDNTYWLLYYQFIKHAFGLRYSKTLGVSETRIALYLDDVPSDRASFESFREYILSLNATPDFKNSRLRIMPDAVVDVDSKRHVLMQVMDIFLGAIHFRLNDFHREKIAGTRRRGKRTIAKERVFRHISSRLRLMHPHFNVGISTGCPKGISDRWNMAYRHWLFIPSEYEIDESLEKP